MIYTSGSTGWPKGAMNTHVAIVNRLLWMQEAYRLTPSDRVLQKTPFSFDVSVWEFFWPLMTGARLVLARPGGHRDGAYLASLIHDEKITTVHFVPSMLSAFLEQKGLESRCGSLKRVICSGEALPFELQQRFFSISRADLHNLYGPTEAAVDVTYWACEREGRAATVPIGRPIANTQIYILDPRLKPTPIGVPGELHIGGVGLARGYHNRPDLTAEKFIRDPFRPEPGARLYKTGDLARYRPDGAIEYLGRLDHQVKIRGFRIESGEIETVLAAHPAVREALVLAREDSPGDKRLVAYLTAKEQKTLNNSDLRDLLRAKLPEYMVPSAYVILDRFPLTPNGKIDRKVLPRPNVHQEAKGGSPQPIDELEIRIAQIWCDVLGVKSVDANSDFFELGGHSLLGARLLARVEAATGRRLGLSTLFDTHSFRAFANLVRSLRPREFDFRQVVRMGSRQAAQSIFAINNTGIFLKLSRRLGEDLSIAALQLRPPDPARKHARDGRRDGRRVRPVDPGGSAHWPVRPSGMVQWRHVGVRDGSSARGRWRGCLLPLPD